MPTLDSSYTIEQSLVAELQSGSKEAFGKLYEKYAASLLGIVIKMTGDQKIAEAVLQKSFIEIWNRKNEYKACTSIFIWMLSLTKKCALSQLPSTNIINSEIHNSLTIVNKEGQLDHVSKQAENEQNVFELLYYKNYSLQQVSEILAIDICDLKTILRSAMKKIKTVRNG